MCISTLEKKSNTLNSELLLLFKEALLAKGNFSVQKNFPTSPYI